MKASSRELCLYLSRETGWMTLQIDHPTSSVCTDTQMHATNLQGRLPLTVLWPCPPAFGTKVLAIMLNPNGSADHTRSRRRRQSSRPTLIISECILRGRCMPWLGHGGHTSTVDNTLRDLQITWILNLLRLAARLLYRHTTGASNIVCTPYYVEARIRLARR